MALIGPCDIGCAFEILEVVTVDSGTVDSVFGAVDSAHGHFQDTKGLIVCPQLRPETTSIWIHRVSRGKVFKNTRNVKWIFHACHRIFHVLLRYWSGFQGCCSRPG